MVRFEELSLAGRLALSMRMDSVGIRDFNLSIGDLIVKIRLLRLSNRL